MTTFLFNTRYLNLGGAECWMEQPGTIDKRISSPISPQGATGTGFRGTKSRKYQPQFKDRYTTGGNPNIITHLCPKYCM